MEEGKKSLPSKQLEVSTTTCCYKQNPVIPVFVNKVLLGHSHTHSSASSKGWLLVCATTAKLSSCCKKPYSLQNFKYLLSGSLRNGLPTAEENSSTLSLFVVQL